MVVNEEFWRKNYNKMVARWEKSRSKHFKHSKGLNRKDREILREDHIKRKRGR
jgi:hypothetical protein